MDGSLRDEPVATLAARTNYFREEYAYGAEPIIEGIEPYLFHEGFADAARKVHGRPVIEPAIVFANLMVPGQELAVHTDVPEFRGCNRKVMPQWLLVAMHHSGLFDEWRMPIATGVAWFHDCEGGEFCFYPDGAEGAPVAKQVAYDTALLFDADSVFHGVDRIAADGAGRDIAPLRPGMALDFAGDASMGRARRRRRRGELQVGRAALQRVVEGVLLRGRARAEDMARTRRRPHDRLRGRPARRRPACARAASTATCPAIPISAC